MFVNRNFHGVTGVSLAVVIAATAYFTANRSEAADGFVPFSGVKTAWHEGVRPVRFRDGRRHWSNHPDGGARERNQGFQRRPDFERQKTAVRRRGSPKKRLQAIHCYSCYRESVDSAAFRSHAMFSGRRTVRAMTCVLNPITCYLDRGSGRTRLAIEL